MPYKDTFKKIEILITTVILYKHLYISFINLPAQLNYLAYKKE